VSSAFQLPRRLPVGTKYVVEICGEFVRRFVELPNGARIPLRNRKARLSISSKRRLNGAGLQGPRWPRQPTRPNHRRKWRVRLRRANERRARWRALPFAFASRGGHSHVLSCRTDRGGLRFCDRM